MSSHQQDGRFTGVIEDVEAHGIRGPLLEEDVEGHGRRGPLLEEDVEAHMPRIGRSLRWDVEGHMPRVNRGLHQDVEDLMLLVGGQYTGAEDGMVQLPLARRVD